MNLVQTRKKLQALPWMRRPVRVAKRCIRFLFGERALPPDELKGIVSQFRWFHSIDLGHGIVTNCKHPTPTRLGWLGLPEDLTGVTVLDVGAWDGFFSFE